MSLEITWSDEVRRFHEFGEDDLTRARQMITRPCPAEVLARQQQPRAPFHREAALMRWSFIYDMLPDGDRRQNHRRVQWALRSLGEELEAEGGRPHEEEARFWFHAFTSADHLDDHTRPQPPSFNPCCVELIEAHGHGDRPLTPDAAQARLGAYVSTGADHLHVSLGRVGWLLDALFSPAETIRILYEACPPRLLVRALATLPALPDGHPDLDARVEALNACYTARPAELRPSHDLIDALERVPSTLIARDVHAWLVAERGGYLDYKPPLWITVGLLDDPALTLATLRRTRCVLTRLNPADVASTRARIAAIFLATGYARLDELVRLANHGLNTSELAHTLPHLLAIHAPELAEALLSLEGVPQADGLHRAYLLAEGANAIAGLLGMAARRGKKRDFALELLAKLVEAGHSDLIARLLPDAPRATQTLVREQLLQAP